MAGRPRVEYAKHLRCCWFGGGVGTLSLAAGGMGEPGRYCAERGPADLELGPSRWRASGRRQLTKPFGWDSLGNLKAGRLLRPVSALARGLISWLSR